MLARGTIVLAATLLSMGCHEIFGVDSIPPTSTFATLADGEVATELVIDGTEVFWTTESEVRSCDLGSCTPQTLATGVLQPHALRIVAGEIRYASADMVYRLPRDLAAAATVLVDRENSRVIVDHVQVGGELYITEDRLARCRYSPTGPCTANNIVLDEIRRGLTIDSSGRIWGADATPVVHVLNTTNRMIDFTLPTTATVRSFVSTTATMFALQTTSDDILAWPAQAAAVLPAVVAVQTTAPTAIAHHREHLWVTNAAGEVLRRPLLGTADDTELFVQAPATIQALAVTVGLGVVALPDRLATFSIPSAE